MVPVTGQGTDFHVVFDGSPLENPSALNACMLTSR